MDAEGLLDLAALDAAFADDTASVSPMWVNNETGVLFPVAEIAARCRARGVPFHCYALQAAGKLPIDLKGRAHRLRAWRTCRLVTGASLRTVFRMPTATKLSLKKPARKLAKKKLPAHGIKAAPGNPFAGLEHVIGSIALPPDPRPPREIIRARILADHNT